MASILGDRKQVQYAQFDNHLTGVNKENFFGSRESENKFAMLKKFIWSKLRAL